VFNPTGTVEWRHNTSALGEDVATAQADDDPALEVFTTATQTVQAIDGATGEVQWTRTLPGAPRLKTIHDGDSDGTPELYVGVFGGTVRALNATTGGTEWTTEITTTEEASVLAPVLGDVNNDSQPAVIAVTESGTVVVLDAQSGAELAVYKRNIPIWTYPTLAEIDGDEVAEILVQYGDGRVVALDYTT
jgi:outer membrane protein assembly factor BamB